jgi:hypothetical protein
MVRRVDLMSGQAYIHTLYSVWCLKGGCESTPVYSVGYRLH